MNRSETRLSAPARSHVSRLDRPESESWREPASTPRCAAGPFLVHRGVELRACVRHDSSRVEADSWYDVFA